MSKLPKEVRAFCKHPKRLVGTYWAHSTVVKVLHVTKGKVICVTIPALQSFLTDTHTLTHQFSYVGTKVPTRTDYVVDKMSGTVAEVTNIDEAQVSLSIVKGDMSGWDTTDLWRPIISCAVVDFFKTYRPATPDEAEEAAGIYARWTAWSRLCLLESEATVRQICDTSWVEPASEGPKLPPAPTSAPEPIRISSWERLDGNL